MKVTLTVGITALVALQGCVATDSLNSWQGHKAQDLIVAMGEPFESLRLADGREEISYQYSYEVIVSRGVSTGSLSRAGGAAERTPQLVYCTVTFRTDPQRTIVGASREGTIAACQRFLTTIAAAQ